MRTWCAHLSTFAHVVTFDYPYMLQGRRRPDPLPKLIAAHREALQAARATHRGPTFLIGKSMGGRVGCHVALQETVAGVICLGYPLKGQTGALRDEVLLALRAPILFIQGTRDPLCPLEELGAVRAKMSAPSDLHIVETGDHSLQASKTHLKSSDVTQEQIDAEVLQRIRAFTRST
jgi:predicted alpha/beta-hydrolase family hydrolase